MKGKAECKGGKGVETSRGSGCVTKDVVLHRVKMRGAVPIGFVSGVIKRTSA